MTKTIYYWFKPGVERDFATTVPPTEDYMAALKEQGYKVMKLSFDVPKELLPAGHDVWLGGLKAEKC